MVMKFKLFCQLASVKEARIPEDYLLILTNKTNLNNYVPGTQEQTKFHTKFAYELLNFAYTVIIFISSVIGLFFQL